MSCVYYSRTKCFKNCESISTDGKVMAKIKVACFFLGHGVVGMFIAMLGSTNWLVLWWNLEWSLCCNIQFWVLYSHTWVLCRWHRVIFVFLSVLSYHCLWLLTFFNTNGWIVIIFGILFWYCYITLYYFILLLMFVAANDWAVFSRAVADSNQQAGSQPYWPC